MGRLILDVEFALGEVFAPYLLQVRAVATQPNRNPPPEKVIGRAPCALAFSRYKTMITDHAWRISRGMNSSITAATKTYI